MPLGPDAVAGGGFVTVDPVASGAALTFDAIAGVTRAAMTSAMSDGGRDRITF